MEDFKKVTILLVFVAGILVLIWFSRAKKRKPEPEEIGEFPRHILPPGEAPPPERAYPPTQLPIYPE